MHGAHLAGPQVKVAGVQKLLQAARGAHGHVHALLERPVLVRHLVAAGERRRAEPQHLQPPARSHWEHAAVWAGSSCSTLEGARKHSAAAQPSALACDCTSQPDVYTTAKIRHGARVRCASVC